MSKSSGLKINFFFLVLFWLFLLTGKVLAGEGICNPLLANGDPTKKINFIFVAENFSDEEKFTDISKSFIGLAGSQEFTLLDYVPYTEFSNEYNVYSLYEAGQDYGCGDSAQVNIAVAGGGSFCFDPKVALTYLGAKCGTGLYDLDYIVVISNKNFRSSADHYTESEINPRTRIIRISYDTSQITPGYEAEVLENSKRTFIHELGHSLGFLTDEYVDLGKKQYRLSAPIGAANVDVAGCPKWCSGQLNKNNPYYQEYVEYQACVQGLDLKESGNENAFLRCYAGVTNTPEVSAFNTNFGIGCTDDAGCYWGAGGLNGFRSRECSLMKFPTCPELGSVNEDIARRGLTNIIRSRKLNIQQIRFEINGVSLVGSERDDSLQQYKFKIDFKLTNQAGEPIIIRANELNYDLYSAVNGKRNLVFLNPEDNSYYTLYEHLVSKKEREDLQIEVDQKVNIDFVAKYNQVENQESYILDLYNIKIDQPGGDETMVKKISEGKNLKVLLNIFFHLDIYLTDLIANYGAWVYLFLFLVIFLETGIVVTPFLPGDSLLFAAGTLAAITSLKIYWLWPLVFVAAVTGDSVNYWLGGKLGTIVFERYPRWFKPHHLTRTQNFYAKHGSWTIVLARFFPVIRTIAPFVAGVGRMQYRKFLLYNLLGGFIWTVLFTFGGYFFGNIALIKRNFEWVILIIIALSFVPALIEARLYRRTHFDS